MKKLLGLILMLGAGTVHAAAPASSSAVPVVPAIYRVHVTSLNQHNVKDDKGLEIHGVHCGYYALYNATRFAATMQIIAQANTTTDARAAVFATTINDYNHFSRPEDPKDTKKPAPLQRWEDRVLAYRGKKCDDANVRALASNPKHKANVYNGNVTALLEEEITEAICGKDPLFIGMRERGQLVIFGSINDFDTSIAEEQFLFDRLGRAMQALQAGLPVGIVLCLGDDYDRAVTTHFVALGLLKNGNDVVVYTMDSSGNHFKYTPENNYPVGCKLEKEFSKQEIAELRKKETEENAAQQLFCAALNQRIVKVATFMISQDPVQFAAMSEFKASFQRQCTNVRGTLRANLANGCAVCTADSPEFELLIRTNLQVRKFLHLAYAVDTMKHIAQNVFGELGEIMGTGIAYTQVAIKFIDDEMRAPAPSEVIDVGETGGDVARPKRSRFELQPGNGQQPAPGWFRRAWNALPSLPFSRAAQSRPAARSEGAVANPEKKE